MFVELAVFAVLFFVCWFSYFRPRSHNQRRPPYKLLSTPESVSSCDYAIIGAGAAGLAAASTLLRNTPAEVKVLLIESGHDAQPSSVPSLLVNAFRRDRLLSFAPDLVKVPVEALPRNVHLTLLQHTSPDSGFVAQRPWHFSPKEEKVVAEASVANTQDPADTGVSPALDAVAAKAEEAKANRYRLLQYAPYPRGCGVGGTSLLDWGMHMNSVFRTKRTDVGGRSRSTQDDTNGNPELSLWTRLPVRFPLLRNPLSWAFAETVKGAKLAEPHLPTPESPVERGTVYPAYLYLDGDGRRLSMPSALLSDLPASTLQSRLRVLTGCKVVDMELSEEEEEGERRVTLLRLRRMHSPASAQTCRVSVSKGVVVSAGAVQTPRLLHRVLSALPRPLPDTVPMRDVLALPLIFPAFHGISADAVNARDAKGTVMWWLTQRGPYLAPLGDTLVSLRLPQLGQHAEMRLLLLPFGGRDAARFKSLGWDTVLATPLQAFTILLLVQGIDGLEHALRLSGEAAPPGAPHAQALCPHNASPVLPETVHRPVQEALLTGMKEARRLTREAPLTDLTSEPGTEAIDFTLLVQYDESKAVRLAQLSRLMATKRTGRHKKELRELREWARALTSAEPYMRHYVDAHAYWLGFASGSSEAFLATRSSGWTSRVDGLRNTVVGDASAVTTSKWTDEGQRDSLAAGSRSTTIDVAVRAVHELLDEKVA